MINILRTNDVDSAKCLEFLSGLGINNKNIYNNYLKIDGFSNIEVSKNIEHNESCIIFYNDDINIRVSLLKNKLNEYNIVVKEVDNIKSFIINRENFNIFMIENIVENELVIKYYFSYNGYFNEYNSLEQLTHYMIESELLPEYAECLNTNDFKLVLDNKNGFKNIQRDINHKRERFNCNKR